MLSSTERSLVLVVDDEVAICQVIQDYLLLRSFDVLVGKQPLKNRSVLQLLMLKQRWWQALT